MFSFIVQFSLMKQTICLSMRPLTSTLFFAEVKDVRVRSFDERTIERWKPNYSYPRIERLSWRNLLKVSFYTVSSGPGVA
jgi:hypothetical protein